MDKIEEHIKALTTKAAEAKVGSEAMHFAQAALNLVNARASWLTSEKLK